MQNVTKPHLTLREALAQNVGILPLFNGANSTVSTAIINPFMGKISTASLSSNNPPNRTNYLVSNQFSSISNNFRAFEFPIISAINNFASTSSALINNTQTCTATTSTKFEKNTMHRLTERSYFYFFGFFNDIF